MTIMVKPEKVRRAGYAPASVELGRRGLRTRESILQSAARLFLDRGFHGTSIDAVAKAAGASRATVYQYFRDKDDIYRELAAQCVPAVLEHAARLGRLGPDATGIQNLYEWLDQWTTLYDEHAVVLLAFPGLGFSTSITAAPDSVSDRYLNSVTDRTRQAGVQGIAPKDAAAAVVRIAQMVNLYRYRGMWGLPDAHTVTASLTVALQLLLFPDTPPAVRDLIRVPTDPLPAATDVPHAVPSVPAPSASPIRSDIVAAAASLFAEHGYYAVGMDDIAAAADVSRATLYRHFRTKVTILSELTQHALAEGAGLAADLHDLAAQRISRNSLHAWLTHYVGFHRRYGSVTQTWYDGGLNKQLADAINTGLGPFQAAATALLNRSGLPEGIDLRVGAAIFLAVLGRLTELTISRRTIDTDYDSANLMLTVLSRALTMKFDTERS